MRNSGRRAGRAGLRRRARAERAGRRELVHQLVRDLVVRGPPLALHLLAHLHAEVAQALAALPPAAAAAGAAAVARAAAAAARCAPVPAARRSGAKTRQSWTSSQHERHEMRTEQETALASDICRRALTARQVSACA